MLDRAALLHDLALAFGANAGPRGLAKGLGEALHRHLAIVEVELAQPFASDRARLLVVAPGTGRQWTGERSRRVLEPMRAELGRMIRCDDEVARVGVEPIAGRLRLELAEQILGVAFSQRALDQLEESDASAMLIAVLDAHARCSTWLLRTAALAQRAHERLASAPLVGPSSVVERPASARVDEPRSVSGEPSSDEPVADFAAAQRDAIAHALTITQGKIYGQGGAAELLGLKPSTLQSKMRKLGLDRAQFARA